MAQWLVDTRDPYRVRLLSRSSLARGGVETGKYNHVMFGRMKKSLPIIVILVSTFFFSSCSRQESQLKDTDVFAVQAICLTKEADDVGCDYFLSKGLRMVDDNASKKDCLRYLHGYLALRPPNYYGEEFTVQLKKFRGTCIDPNGKDYFGYSK